MFFRHLGISDRQSSHSGRPSLPEKSSHSEGLLAFELAMLRGEENKEEEYM